MQIYIGIDRCQHRSHSLLLLIKVDAPLYRTTLNIYVQRTLTLLFSSIGALFLYYSLEVDNLQYLLFFDKTLILVIKLSLDAAVYNCLMDVF